MKAKLLSFMIYGWLKSLRISFSQNIPQPPHLWALWHRDLPACMAAFAHRNIHVMISASQDGNIARKIAQWMGYNVYTGSSSRRAESLRHLLRSLHQHQSVGMALDGPRGPQGIAKPGIFFLQKRSQLPIALIQVQYQKSYRLKTWDRMEIPLPFTSVRISVKYLWNLEGLVQT